MQITLAKRVLAILSSAFLTLYNDQDIHTEHIKPLYLYYVSISQ